ncbi:MAG: anti-sigma regulatory factor [Salinivirgaceae bacterium]|nr:anti-sigma regulatory factor [Salinivirgaceae bacterium]
MGSQIHTYTFNASLEVLEEIRNLISQKGNEHGYSKKEIYNLTLAVDEIATNIINHGYIEKGIKKGTFNMLIELHEKQLIVRLVDGAVPYNPIDQNLPSEELLNTPLEDRPIGGLGIMIAKQSVDEFKYEFIEGKNNNIFVVNKK